MVWLIGLDTAPLIYIIEEHPFWLARVRPFFKALDEGLFRAVTSTVTLTEVLVYPFRRSERVLAEQYREILLRGRNLNVMPVTTAIAEKAAEFRAHHNLRTPDAIQLATAIHANAELFLTNDKKLAIAASLRIITLEELPAIQT